MGVRLPRRASRVLKYLLWGLAVAIIAHWSRSCDVRQTVKPSKAPVDFSWGSLLHRFQNHPRTVPPRASLPWKRSGGIEAPSSTTRVLIVTAELAGLHKNGGIGTAYTELAAALATRQELEVSILIAHESKRFPVQQREGLEASLLQSRIHLHFVQEEHQPIFPAAWTPTASARVWEWLRRADGEYDIIHFPDNTGIGYFSTLGKYEGLALRGSKIVVGLHGADAEWAAMLNKKYPKDRYAVDLGEFERRTVEMADVVVAPSEYILEYYRSRGWITPPHSFVIPNIVKSEPLDLAQPPTTEDLVQPITELVFFGRLEERKGTRLFVQVLEQLYSVQPHPPFTNITFLGRDTSDEKTSSDASSLITQAMLAIQEHLDATFEFNFLMNADREQALAYLQQPHRLAVLPALADNSPSTVLECVIHTIRFIASSVGGIPELIHQDDQARVLFAPLVDQFAKKIKTVTEQLKTQSWVPVRPRPETVTASQDWIDLHSWIAALPPPLPPAGTFHPIVSICITHYERPHLITQLLDSLLDQSYTQYQVVLVDDGSTSPEAVAQLQQLEEQYFRVHSDWRILRIENSYLGEARNRAAALAEGEWLLFLDDDDVLKPHALETLVAVAAKTKVAALSTWLDEFATDVNPLKANGTLPHRRTYWFLGQSISAGMMSNCFGSGNIFVSQEAFKSIGGFSTYREVGAEDWEFYVRLALAHHKQLTVPEELIFVRSDPSRYSMKFAMDPWDANYHALIPILNDARVQELGLPHALMLSKSAATKIAPPPPVADSYQNFQLIQGWAGWHYSFEPVDGPPTLDDDRQAILWDGQWAFDRDSAGGFISEDFQKPHVTSKGNRFAAVRTFRAPKAMDVAVEVSYRAEHQCGDGTDLAVMSKTSIGEDWVEHMRWHTMESAAAEYRVDLSLRPGSRVALWLDPLMTDECDIVEVHMTLVPIVVDNLAWSSIASRAHVAATDPQPEESVTAKDDWTPVANSIEVAVPPPPDSIYHIALIFDRGRLPHALQVMRSAVAFITSRTVHIHAIAPDSLHQELYDFARHHDFTLRTYGHELCRFAVKPVMAFSNPDIHLSAHCKMFLADIISGDVEEILYLDTDVTILSDISECYSRPELTSTLISMGVDMGDACQTTPEACWPIGMHWRVPSGLVCGNVPSKGSEVAGHDCAGEGELEAVQVNGGVALMQLKRMRDVGFPERYVQTVVHHYRVAGSLASWGEQDYINSYFRLFPGDLEFLPCGCNYQWFGSRREVKCGAQPLYIAHHWSHGIAGRSNEPFNVLFHHFLDQNETNSDLPVPPFPALSPSLPGAPNVSHIDIEHTLNCPRQLHDCSDTFRDGGQFGQPVKILSRVLNEVFVSDLVDTIDFQTYPSIEHYAAVRPSADIPSSTVKRETIELDADLEGDYEELCKSCGALAKDRASCTAAPSGFAERKAYWDCACDTPDSSAPAMYELETLAGAGEPGWALYLNDDRTFVEVNSLSLLMAQVDDRKDLILFRSDSTSAGHRDYRKKVIARSEMDGVGFLVHSSHLDFTEWDGSRCGISSTFSRLSNRLRVKWLDLIPTMTHPLQRHLPAVLADDFKVTIIILETLGRISWTPFLIEVISDASFSPVVKEFVVVSVDAEEGAYGRDVKIVNPSAGSGLAELAALASTDAVLLLSDSITLDRAALNALLTYWLDDPLRLVGIFTETVEGDFSMPLTSEQEGFDVLDEVDPIIGIPRFSHLLPRTLLTHKSHLQSLADVLAETSPSHLHPVCHPLLLSALASKANGGLSPLRILPPPSSLTDRVHNCRSRNWADVDQGQQQVGDFDPDSDEATYTPMLEECIEQIDVLLGGPGKVEGQDSLKKEWLEWGQEIGTTGPLGVKRETITELIDEDRWKAVRRIEACEKD